MSARALSDVQAAAAPDASRPVPAYGELLTRTDAPPGSSWNLFGAGDQLGMLNFLTPERAVAAARLVRRGVSFNLDYPLDAFVPSVSGTRPKYEHHLFSNEPHHRDDWLDSFYLQSTTQVDGLRHIRHPEFGFYGGVPDDAVTTGTADLGIHLVAEKAVVARGVLLDAARYFADTGRPLYFGKRTGITPDDLDAMVEVAGVELAPGDVVLLRTGFAEQWLSCTPEQMAARTGEPGLDQSEEMLAWIWDHQLAMMASDSGGLEAQPVRADSGWVLDDEPPPERGPSHNGMMHRPLIGLLGLTIGELWKLDELAADCAADGVNEFLLTVKPLNLVGGVGSPANAIAVK